MKNNLAHMRRAKEISQTKLADLIGVSPKSISAYEKGRRTPSIKVMQKFEDFFDTPKEDIFPDAFDYSK